MPHQREASQGGAQNSPCYTVCVLVMTEQINQCILIL